MIVYLVNIIKVQVNREPKEPDHVFDSKKREFSDAGCRERARERQDPKFNSDPRVLLSVVFGAINFFRVDTCALFIFILIFFNFNRLIFFFGFFFRMICKCTVRYFKCHRCRLLLWWLHVQEGHISVQYHINYQN